MPLITEQISNLINGVSQQPPSLRLASQAEVQENGMVTIAEGLKKRPPLEHVVKLNNKTDTDAKVHFINRDADERYGDMMFEKDPKMIIGYQMWARKVVKYMKNNPNNTKMAYWLFKPWTEYMGYEMGIVEKPTLRGRFTHWVGKQISYITFNLFGGQYLLNKYNKLKLDN